MQKIILPKECDWPSLWQRPVQSPVTLGNIVRSIFEDVQRDGDEAVLAQTRRFDWGAANSLTIDPADLVDAARYVPDGLKNAIKLAAGNIELFHSSQRTEASPKINTAEGVLCWQESKPIERVGIYIPGGSAPLFSTVLMLAIPAQLAGCKQIILCTPPDREGTINPAILYAAALTGVTSVCKAGGVQAIAAMTFGTATIPKVDKLFGPGNQYVTAAKTLAQQYGMAIDLPAGPSELLVIADRTANPAFVAADLLSQAEHGIDSQVILLSDDEYIIDCVLNEIEGQLADLPRKAIAERALKNSKAILLRDQYDCMHFSNGYAPEHLILALGDAETFVTKVVNAGSVFLGHYSCESAGDYATGTNHTLPTNGYARSYSGVTLDSFLKKISFQSVSKQGLENIGPAIEQMAEAEGLAGHKNAVSIRMRSELKILNTI